MQINIAEIKNYEGKQIAIDCQIDLKQNELDDFELLGPITVRGVIRNFGGTIELDAKANARLRMTCDRCAEEFDRDIDFDILESFKEEGHKDAENENPDITYFTGDSIDLDEWVYTDLVLSLPGKHLCSEDCRGLCPQCGANLNMSECSCDTRPIDPRFSVLDDIDVD